MAASLIVNADDFGLTPGVNRAIGELAAAGAISSATLMATGAAFEDAVRVAKQNPTLGVGCHVTLVDGMPMSHAHAIPSLLGADGKSFKFSLPEFHYAVLRGRVSDQELVKEIAAQVQKLQRAGLDVTHLDSHKHTHIAPQVARAMVFVAERAGIAAMRNPFEPAWAAATAPGLRRRAEVALMRRFAPHFLALPAIREGSIATTLGTLGIASTGSMNADTLSRLIAAAPPRGVFELMVHPGYVDDALASITTRLRAHREIERDALLQHSAQQTANPSHDQLIHYGDLGHAGVLRRLGQHTPATGFETIL